MLKLGLITVLVSSLLFVSGCAPAEATEGGFDWSIIIFLALIFGVFYFLFIRPQRKKQKEHRDMTLALKVGDKIITAGGIYGKIESMGEDSVVLRVESDARIRVAINSIAGKRPS